MAVRRRGLARGLGGATLRWVAISALAVFGATPGVAQEQQAAAAEPDEARTACPAGIEPGAQIVVGEDTAAVLEPLIPPELWEKREAFFFEGMTLHLGACQRSYPVPAFFSAATRANAGKARVDPDGNLQGYRAGLPFPRDAIDPTDSDAGARWAWNHAWRYRGAGPRGEIVLHELMGGKGRSHEYSGNWYQHFTRHRADLVDSGYRAAYGAENVWVAGGRFRRPGAAANLSWRQFRPAAAQQSYRQSDNVFVYVPNIRKSRRSATAWSDGLFVPRYTVSQLGSGPVLGRERDLRRPQDLHGAAPSEDIRHGLVGLVYRPNAYTWKLADTRVVLAPLNVVDRPGAGFDWAGYQKIDLARYGPRGVAFDGERWDARRALVLEGTPRKPAGLVYHLELWIDADTLHPLYVVERTSRGKTVQVGMLLHSFSADAEEYPEFAEGVAADVFDPVAQSFLATGLGGASWRRESWGATSVPVSDLDLKRMSSTTRLKTLP